MLEMGQDQRGAGNVTDLAGADGDVLEGAPALGEQREPAFSQAAQGALERVIGASADIEVAAASRLSDREEDAEPLR